MDRDLVTIATFATAAEASGARSTLESAGIRTYLHGGATADVLAYYGTAIGGARLQVEAADLQRACDVLGIGADDEEPTEEIGPWTCPQCGERIEAGFAVCWSCGTAYGEGPASSAEQTEYPEQPAPTGATEPTRTCPMCGAAVAERSGTCSRCGETFDGMGESAADPAPETGVRPPETDDDEIPEHVRHAHEVLERAFRCAIIGIALCPPVLNVYSITKLIEYAHLRREYGWRRDWREIVALLVDVGMIGLTGTFIMTMSGR